MMYFASYDVFFANLSFIIFPVFHAKLEIFTAFHASCLFGHFLPERPFFFT